MTSYIDRIMRAIEESENGLTTVDVAKRAGVSKTTVIKYLSVLKSEGKCEFVEVGPSKLWRSTRGPREPSNGNMQIDVIQKDEYICQPEHMSIQIPDADDLSKDATISLSFKVKPDQICSFIKQVKKCYRQCP